MTFEHAFLILMALGFFRFLLLCGVSERVLEWANAALAKARGNEREENA